MYCTARNHGTMNKLEWTYPQNGQASLLFSFAGADYHWGKLPPVHMSRDFLT